MKRPFSLAVLLLTSAAILAQILPQDPPPVTFRAQTRLVLLAFHVLHGKNYVSALKSSDVVLREDGQARDFTIFDSPATQERMPLELVLLFDANPKIEYFWDPADVFRFIPQWTDALSQTILRKGTADVRISVYRCEERELFRLSPATTDPAQLSGAFRRILKPQTPESAADPSDVTIPITLPPNREVIDPGPFTGEYKTSPFLSAGDRGWPLEAAIGALNDVSAAQDRVSRVLVMFSEGIGATTTIPEDVGSQALDLGIPIYPIVTNYKHHIQFFLPRNLYRMHQYAALGKMTGGLSEEYSVIDAATLRKILEDVKSGGLSQYVVGFSPTANDSPKMHNLEIRLASKLTGTVEGGKRRAVY